MRTDLRKPGQSLLDYLWVNFGNYFVSDNVEEGSIPTSALLETLVQNVSDKALANLKVSGDRLVGYNSNNEQIFSLDISEITSLNRVIVSFEKRYITLSDVDNGCIYAKGTPVYSLLFSDDSELIAKIDEYQGENTNSIAVNITEHFISARLRVDNETSIVPIKETRNGILADLNISEDVESIEFTKEIDGLKARILLDNGDKSLKFKYLTLSDYLAIEEPDTTTVYFIQGKKYFYFGRYLIGVNEEFYTKEEIDEKIDKLHQDSLIATLIVDNSGKRELVLLYSNGSILVIQEEYSYYLDSTGILLYGEWDIEQA